MMACFLVGLDKAPGVCPVVIGEIICRLLSKCVLLVTGSIAIEEHDNLNLCSGSVEGIEGAVHATLVNYSKAQCPLKSYQVLLDWLSARYNSLRGAGKEEE